MSALAAQGLDGMAEAEAAEAAVRAATEGISELGTDAAPGGEAGGGASAAQAALDQSGGTMGATHVWQGG